MSLELYRRRSGQDDRHDITVDYSLEVDVAMDGLHPSLDRDRSVAGEGSYAGSITGTDDALGHTMV